MMMFLSFLSTIGYFFGLLWMRIGAGSQYEWTQDMDPSFTLYDKDADDWVVILIVAFIFTLATQVPFLFSKYRKYHATLIVIATALFFWMRQW